MEKPKVTYTFIDPNRPEAVTAVLRSILVEKLTSEQAQSAPGSGQ